MRNPYETVTSDAEDDWRGHAACVGKNPELFFPTTGSAKSAIALDQAKAVCAGCRVQETCLRWAIRTESDYGVWGGIGESERRSLQQRTGRRGSAQAF